MAHIMFNRIHKGCVIEVETPKATYTFTCVDPDQALFEAEKAGKLEEKVRGRLAYARELPDRKIQPVYAGIREGKYACFQYQNSQAQRRLCFQVTKLTLYDENGVDVRSYEKRSYPIPTRKPVSNAHQANPEKKTPYDAATDEEMEFTPDELEQILGFDANRDRDD